MMVSNLKKEITQTKRKITTLQKKLRNLESQLPKELPPPSRNIEELEGKRFRRRKGVAVYEFLRFETGGDKYNNLLMHHHYNIRPPEFARLRRVDTGQGYSVPREDFYRKFVSV